MTRYETLRVERRGTTAIVTLDRPERLNAINEQMARDIPAALGALEDDSDVRAVVLTGTGRAFCAGGDISEAGAVLGVAGSLVRLRRVRRMFDAIADFPLPTVAAINGLALGGGLEITLACDFRILGSGTEVGLPEIDIGALPGGGGMSRLPALVGLARAKEIVMTGRRVAAEEAYYFGLVTEVVADDKVLERAAEFADQFASKPAAVLKLAKRAVQVGAGSDGRAAAELEFLATVGAFGTEDRTEGMAAFLEKRDASFTGR
jgi:enoyl-CoA hydratase